MAELLTFVTRDVLHHLRNGSLPPTAELKLLFSKLLGLLVIAGACFVKIPQILSVAKSKSAAGLNPLSFELEETALFIHSSYGFILGLPFSAYGEALILLLQNTAVVLQIYHYSKAPSYRPALAMSALVAGIASVMSGRVTVGMISSIYNLNNVIMIASRVPQIYQNYQAQSTGQLSLFTYAANLFGCAARIFTSFQEGAGMAMVRGFLLGGLLNGTLAFQILYYNHRPSTQGAPDTKKEL